MKQQEQWLYGLCFISYIIFALYILFAPWSYTSHRLMFFVVKTTENKAYPVLSYPILSYPILLKCFNVYRYHCDKFDRKITSNKMF